MTNIEPEDPDERLRRLLDSEEETRADLPANTDPQKNGSLQTPIPPSGSTPPLNLPALDRDNMPLPRRVDQIDVDGTRVTPAAYDRPSTGRRQAAVRVTRPPHNHPGSPRRGRRASI